LEWPRDEDLLRELRARAGVVASTMLEQQQRQPEERAAAGAAAAGSCSSSSSSSHQQPDLELYKQWKEQEGGLIYFRNTRVEEGLSLELQDGREFLPGRVMLDLGCNVPLLSTFYGTCMGLKEVPLEQARRLIRADGKLATVTKQFPNIRVRLAARTPWETSYLLNFYSMPDADSLYQACIPTTFDHRVAALGVDRVRQLYCWRPRYAEHMDLDTVASVPVRCLGNSGGAGATAASLLWSEVREEAYQQGRLEEQRVSREVVAAIFSRVLEQGGSKAGKAGVVGSGKEEVVAQCATAAGAAVPGAGLPLPPRVGQGVGQAQGPALPAFAALAFALVAASSLAGPPKGLALREKGASQPAGAGEEPSWLEARENWEGEEAASRGEEEEWAHAKEEWEEDWQDADDGWGSAGWEEFEEAPPAQQGSGLWSWAVEWVGVRAWEGLGMVLLLVLLPGVLLQGLHAGLAALCWQGWRFKSRQQKRHWARTKKKRFVAHQGWSIRQWGRASVMLLLLLMAWCCCSAQAMDPRGLETSLLLTAGLAVLRMRHPGGAAPCFRP
jgi:hypothetical protein